MNAKQDKPMVSVDAVEKFMAEVEQNCKEVESKVIVLKTRVAKRTISEASIMHDLDAILKIIRR